MRRLIAALIFVLTPLSVGATGTFVPASPFSLMSSSHMSLTRYFGSPLAEVSIFARTMRRAAHATLATSVPAVPNDSVVPSPAPTPAEASARIIAQPSEINAGESTLVSWSSVGMSTASPCLVTNGHDLAESNAGSIRVTLRMRQVYTFRLICTSERGESIVEGVAVSVR